MIQRPAAIAPRAARTRPRPWSRAIPVWAAAGAVLLLSGVAIGNPVDQLLGRRVSEVRVVSGGIAVADPQLLTLLDVRPGDELSVGAVRQSIVHLMGLGRFQDVRVDATNTPDGVRLVIELVPVRDVKRLVFRGDLGLPEFQLRAAVVDRFGATPSVGRAGDIASALEEHFRGRGFLRPKVAPLAEGGQPSGSGDLVFDVAAGPQARVERLELQGPSPDLLAALPQRLQVHEGDRYDPTALQTRANQYVDEWHAGGYYGARLDRAVRVNDTRDLVTLTITFDRGPLVAVDFRGDPLPPRERADLVPIGREGAADEDLLEDSERRIEDYLRARGYRDARAPYDRREQDGRLSIVFDVQRGPLYRVTTFSMPTTTSVPHAELRALLKVSPGQPFVQARLDADVAAIAADYRRRGYASVAVSHREQVDASPGTPAGERGIEVQLEISEGARTVVGAVLLEGNVAIDTARLAPLASVRIGEPFDPRAIEADKDRFLIEYANAGYRMARVESDVALNDERTDTRIRYLIHEGAQVLVDHILVIGNRRISENTIRRELVLVPGQPLGLAAINESQRRLGDLGLFRRVTISELQHGTEARRDVLVAVEEAPSTTLGYGGGVEFQKVETSEFAPRGFFELGRRNLWGKNRSLNLYSRISVRRRDVGASASTDGTGAYSTTEYRVVGSYREPRFLQTPADLQMSLLFEQGSRTSFSFRRRSVRVEVSRRFSRTLSLVGQYSLERNDLLEERLNPTDKPLIDRLFPSVRLSTFSATTLRDTRDDPIDPASGSLFGLTGELALVPLGSEIGFAKTFLQAFTYRKLPFDRRLVFAGGLRVGLGTGFPRTATVPGQPDVTVRDLPANERFFGGGDTTVRGFQLDHLGAPATFDRDGQPKGGHALVILNGELRLDVWRDVGLVGFLDLGNVFAKVTDIGPGHLRASAGIGIRYRSPVGPLRFDMGFKLGSLLTFAQTKESRTALHISIGQAF
jgi:outer membrane protein insertion porin family